VPPPAPIVPPPDPALARFNLMIRGLNELRTKSFAVFDSTVHSASDLEKVADFIHAVADRAHERDRRMSSDEDEGQQAVS
jgi:hypothetical protein